MLRQAPDYDPQATTPPPGITPLQGTAARPIPRAPRCLPRYIPLPCHTRSLLPQPLGHATRPCLAKACHPAAAAHHATPPRAKVLIDYGCGVVLSNERLLLE